VNKRETKKQHIYPTKYALLMYRNGAWWPCCN